MGNRYKQSGLLGRWVLGLALLAMCSTGAYSQVGLVWAKSDYSTGASMSSTAHEVTYDIATTDSFVYALVGRAGAMDGEVDALFLYKYTPDGDLVRRLWLTDSTITSISTKFLIPNVNGGYAGSLSSPRKMHLEINGNNLYIAGTIKSSSQDFPRAKTTIPRIPQLLKPVLFIAQYSITELNTTPINTTTAAIVNGITFLYPQNGNLTYQANTTAFISDLDIDESTGNVYAVGVYRERSVTDNSVPIIYIPPKFPTFPDFPFALRPTADPAPRDSTIVAASEQGGLKSNTTFQLFSLVGTNASTGTMLMSSQAPSVFGGGASCSGELGEFNFWISYTPSLDQVVMSAQILGNKTLNGTIVSNAISIDGRFVYVGGHFNRPAPHCVAHTSVDSIALANIMAPSFVTGTPIAATASAPAVPGSVYVQSGFIAKYEKDNAALVYEQRFRGEAQTSVQDILVKDDRVLLAVQTTKNNTYNNNKDLLYIPTNSYYTTHYDLAGTRIENSMFLMEAVNSIQSGQVHIYPCSGSCIKDRNPKDIHIFRYQEISSPGVFAPYTSADAIQMDNDGNVFLSMVFTGNLNLRQQARTVPLYSSSPSVPSVLSNAMIASGSTTDIGVVKYDNSMGYLWSIVVGGTESELQPTIGLAKNNRDFFLGGAFQGAADMDPSSQGIFTLTSRGQGHDAFLAKYGCPKIEVNTDSITVRCEGTPIRLRAEVDCPSGNCNINYRWVAPDGSQFFAGSEYTFSPDVGTNVRIVEATDLTTGCVVADTVSIDISQRVTVLTQPTSAQICAGTSIAFSANANLPGASYKWYYSNSNTPIDTTNTVIATSPGSYRVVASLNGCEATAVSLLNQYNQQSPQIFPDTALLCGGNIQLQVNGCPGCAFNWTPPLGSGSFSNTSAITANTVGTYVVNMVDNNGCTYLLSKNVTNSSFLVPSIASRTAGGVQTNAICTGQPLIIETLPACATCTYRWNNGSTSNFTFAFNPGNYQVTVVNTATGCMGTSNIFPVQSSSLVAPTVEALPSKICTDLSATTDAMFVVSNQCAGCYYRWYDNSSINTVVAIGASVSLNTAGDYVLRVTDTLNCSEYSSVIEVEQEQVSLPTITSNHRRLCGSNSATLSTTACNGCQYKWYRQTSGIGRTEISGATNHTYTTNLAGTYFVEVYYANGCVRFSNPLIIEFDAAFSVAIDTQTRYVCAGQPVTLNASGSFLLPPLWNYQWYRNGVPVSDATGYNYTTNQAGTYYLRVIDQDSCVANSSLVNVFSASDGSNPVLTAVPNVLCESDTALLTVVHSTCDSCAYGWYLDNNAAEAFTLSNSHQTPNKRGYYAVVFDLNSTCYYLSNVIQIRDTILPAPVIAPLNNPLCSPIGVSVLLSTTARTGAQYIWMKAADTIFIGTQNTFAVTDVMGAGNYNLIIKQGNCYTAPSNDIPVSFSTFNAQLFATSNVICNGDSVFLYTLPRASTLDSLSGTSTPPCVGCTYQWFNDGVLVPNSNVDSFKSNLGIIAGGNYYAVIANAPLPGIPSCADTTNTINIQEASALAQLQTSTAQDTVANTAFVCGATNQTVLSVTPCVGCTYSWYYGVGSYGAMNLISSLTGSSISITGSASAGFYRVEINSNGCISGDQIQIIPTSAFDAGFIFSPSITGTPSVAHICAGSPIAFTDTSASVSRRWVRNAVPISGLLAEQSSYQTVMPGLYSLIATDIRGCIDTTSAVTVLEYTPAPGYSLILDPVNPVPITSPSITLDNYLQPVSVRTGVGGYTSLTASGALNPVNQTFNPSIAGPGQHIIYYHDTLGSCVFTVFDTIEVLQATNVDIINRRLNNFAAQCPPAGCPQYEACLQDSMRVILTNFPFLPNRVQFMTDTGYISVPVTPVVNPIGSVWSGYIPVIVPNNARTGKLRLVNGLDMFQTTFFLVVQNPAVAIDLAGVQQPLCSNNPNAQLVAVPSTGNTGFGTLSAAYLSAPTTPVPALLTSDTFYAASPTSVSIPSIIGYDLNGRQDMVITYQFRPVYTGTTITCPNAVIDTMHIQARSVALTSVEYTPIAVTQASQALAPMTRFVFPLATRLYANSYSGTYVNNNSILPSTITTGAGPQAVTYHISNAGCTNSTTSNVSVLPSPSLSVIPNFVCRRPNDTIFIGRNASGPYITRNGVTTQFDPQYTYQNNTVFTADYGIVEHIHSMTLASSNGGLIPINLANGVERYALVPSSITGNTTTLTLTYRYYRTINYFDAAAAVDPTDTAAYVIAQIQRVVNFEDLPAVLINPAILADPVFCKENTFFQFSGTPNGGQYYLYNAAATVLEDTLENNLFNPTDYVATAPLDSFTLRYVFVGNACIDSAQTVISIVRPFSITLTAPSAPAFCQEEPNSVVSAISNIQAPNQLNLSSGLFYVGGVQSGNVFSPSLRYPSSSTVTEPFAVAYTIADIYGCTAEDTTTFFVHPTPVLGMTALAPVYCANDPVMPLQLFSNGTDITTAFGTNIVTLSAVGLMNPSPGAVAPSYYPLQATATRRDTTVRDTIVYTLIDGNGCTATLTHELTIRELPFVGIVLSGGEPVPSSFCEGDTAKIVGVPLGGSFSNVETQPLGYPFSLNAATGDFYPQIAGATPNSITEEYLYTYANNATGCRDTIRDTILILNRAQVTITGLPSATCASDAALPLGIISVGPAVTAGVFTGFPASSVGNNNIPASTAEFYPDSAGIFDTPTSIGVRLDYASNGCNSRADTFILVNPLPQLSFNMPGDTLAGGTIDRRYHICESADSVPLYANNRFMTNVAPVFPETGVFTARGVRMFGDPLAIPPTTRYIYFARDAVFGPDTIRYTYTDPRGCTNFLERVVVVDTVPALGFAGFAPSTQIGSNPDTFSYCGNDAPFLVVPSPFGGLLTFQQQLQQSGVLNLDPSQLAAPATYELGYTYISHRYTNGRVCQDSIKSYVEIRPVPVLSFVSVPTQICVDSSTAPVVLQASPVGGIFRDVSNGTGVAGGILADSIFQPAAQFGIRTIEYLYQDPVTLCSDTIAQNISVFRTPLVSFLTGGGCEGDDILFNVGATGLVNTAPSRDSITGYVWEYGDGIIDSLGSPVGGVVVPNRTYEYLVAGIYFPRLTVTNRGVCTASYQERIVVSPKVVVTPALPYIQGFDNGAEGWFQETVDNSNPLDSLWDFGWATGSRITTAQVENNVWVTRAALPYQPGDRGWVYSPCFDISALRRPMVSMDTWIDSREGIDGAVLEFFHPTQGWVNLGQRDKGINWYDSLYLISAPGAQVLRPNEAPIGWSGENLDGFVSSRYRLDTDTRNGDLRGMTSLRMRVSFAAAENTAANGREGFAFDNVYVGERGRSVLVEHFSNQNIQGIGTLEPNLYRLIYSNLYGRDVTLLQYQTPLGGADSYYNQAQAETNARTLFYGVSESAKKVRINGQNYVSTTEELVNNVNGSHEYLDMEMLKPAAFHITIPTVPQIFQAGTGAATGTANVVVAVKALVDLPTDPYVVHAVITEDSLRSTQRHNMMSVVRAMRADVALGTDPTAGTPFERPWVAGDEVAVTLQWSFPTNIYRRHNLRMNVFVQNNATKEVLQVATSRDLTVFNGPVNVDELTAGEGKEIMDFKLYPNPAQSHFTIEFDQPLEGEYEWAVVDMLGRVLRTGKAQAGERTIQVDTDDFSAAMYIFSINNQTVYSQRQVIITKP